MPRDGRLARELRPRLPGAASPSKVASTFLQQQLQVSAQSLLILHETKMKEAFADGVVMLVSLIACLQLR